MAKVRYILQRQLGAGGMGEVWLAKDTLLNRLVAIKYLMAAEQALNKEYFLSEAQLLASMHHPNITLLYDAVFDEDRKQFYLVMEYVDGKSLDNILGQWTNPLPLKFILDIAMGILQALEYAHGKGVVHRDIKPGNVVVQQNQVKLTDFGVAGLISKFSQGSPHLAGTIEYMAPEQIDGSPVDGRADLYSLGIMLYELISGGRLPFEHYTTKSDIIKAHIFETPPSLRLHNATLPWPLEHLTSQLMEKDPQRRPVSAGAALRVLKAIQARYKTSQAHLKLLEPETGPFVGRARAMETLQTLWAEVQASVSPRLCVIEGGAGLGKTRLASEFIGQYVVAPGHRAIAGRSDEFGIPYAPFSEILATILKRNLTSSPLNSQQTNLLFNQMPGLARLLQLPHDFGNPPPGQGAEQAHWQFFAAVLYILSDISPAAIFIEDATHLDEASINLIRFLSQREALPLLFLLNARPAASQAPPWYHSLPPARRKVIKLPPLSQAETETYLKFSVGESIPPAAVDQIYQRSAGTPLQIEQFARHLVESQRLYQNDVGQWQYKPPLKEARTSSFLPRSLSRIIGQQIDQLSPDQREALALAAMVEDGTEFDFESWLQVLGGEPERARAQEILKAAADMRLVRRVTDGRHAFRPADVGQVLLDSLPDDRRLSLHKQVIDTLKGLQASPIVIAHHYEQVGLIEEAAEFLQQAGDDALASYAIDAAIDYYKRAVELVPSVDLYIQLGDLYRQTGRWSTAEETLKQGLNSVRDIGSVADEAHLLNRLSFTLWMHDQYRTAYQHAHSVLRLPGVPEAERAAAQSHLGMISWLTGRLAEAEDWCQQALQTLRQSGDESTLAAAYNRLGLVHFSQGQFHKAEQAFQRSLDLRQKLAEEWGEAYCWNNLAKVALERGQFRAANKWLEQAEDAFEKIGSQDGLMVVYTNMARASLYQDQPDQALLTLATALSLATRIGKRGSYGLSEIYLLMAQASLKQGHLERARAAVNDALQIVRAAGNQEYMARGQALMAHIYALQGEQARAESTFEKALALFEQVGSQADWLRTRLTYAHFLAQWGRPTEANALQAATRHEAEALGLRAL